ncbi:MAG: hypothetical protein CMJ64_11025 [Planctomycetaceae bacterium]|nr:hypothetical protein [Planctomycetaceae bacterium]
MAPILMSTFVVSFEFCRVHMIRHSIENAVYEASRVGLVPQTTDAEIRQTANNMMAAVQVDGADVTVSQTAEQVSVQISVDFEDAAWDHACHLQRQHTLCQNLSGEGRDVERL